MVNLKQEGTCKSKTGGAKMTKIFATKALSMVLCFVMLFMGAPVTTWAAADPSVAVTGDTTLAWNDSMPSSVSLTATGFASEASYSWALSTAADTYVTLSGGSTDTATVTYDKNAVESPTEVTVTVTDTTGGVHSASTTLLLLPEGQCLVIRDKDNKLVTEAPSLAAVGDSLTFEAHGFGDGATTDFEWSAISDDMRTFVTPSALDKNVLKLELKALPAFDVTLPVKAQGTGEYTSQEDKTFVKLKKPDNLTVALPDDDAATGISEGNGVVTVSSAKYLEFSPVVTVNDTDTDVAA